MWFLIRLLLIVILLLLIRHLWRSLAGAVKREGGLPQRPDFSPQMLVHDPECGLHFPLNDAVTVRTDKGLLYFCSRECRDRYLGKQKNIQE